MAKNLVRFFLFAFFFNWVVAAKSQDREKLRSNIKEYLNRLERADCRFVSYWYGRIAACYDSLKMPEMAIYYYREGAVSWIPSRATPNNRNAIILADFFLNKSQFDSALFFLKYRKAQNDSVLRTGHPTFYHDADISYRMMLAYNGLGLIDSAINVFLPFAFLEWTDAEGLNYDTAHVFLKDYHCQLRDFLGILGKRYSASYIPELFCEIRNPRLVELKDSSGKKCNANTQLWVRILNKEILFSQFPSECEYLKAPDITEAKCYVLEQYYHTLLFMWAVATPRCNFP